MASYSTSKPRYEVRSISLPPRSHPTTLLVHQQLNKLKSRDTSISSSASICFALAGLEELYRRVDHVLNLPMTREALSQHRHEKWASEVLDGSMRLLDTCGSIRDTLSSIKENLRDLQSSLRRRKAGDSQTDVNAYISFMRRIKKEAERTLKHMDKKTESPVSCLDLDIHISGVVREAGGVAGDVFRSLLSFLSMAGQEKERSSRWRAVARMVRKGAVRCESLNELEAVDRALTNIKNGEDVNKKALEAMEMAIQGIEDGLECVFRRLIHTRVSFLNILSH